MAANRSEWRALASGTIGSMPVPARHRRHRHPRHPRLLGLPRLTAACGVAVGACVLQAGLSGCSLGLPPIADQYELSVNSLTMPELQSGGSVRPAFCLHLRQNNHFFGLYSDNVVQSWATEGRCDTAGAAQRVAVLRLSWHYAYSDTQDSLQCERDDHCNLNAKFVLLGQRVACASAAAQDGNQTAFITLDKVSCP